MTILENIKHDIQTIKDRDPGDQHAGDPNIFGASRCGFLQGVALVLCSQAQGHSKMYFAVCKNVDRYRDTPRC